MLQPNNCHLVASIGVLNPNSIGGARSDSSRCLVNGAIQTSWYVNSDAFGQAFRAHGSPPLTNIRLYDSLQPTRETMHGIASIGCVPPVLSRAYAGTDPAAAP